jgi:hypothetical protein
MDYKSIDLLRIAYQRGHTTYQTARAVGCTDKTAGNYFRQFAADGMVRGPKQSGMFIAYVGPELIGKAA